MDYFAHIVSETGEKQTVLEHLQNTAEMTSKFAAAFGAEEAGYLCGLLHDVGKYTDKFQRRIRGAGEKVDHSTAGALEALKAGHAAAAFCIAGHHGGMPDGGTKKSALPEDATFFGKMKRVPGRDIEDYSAFKSELQITGATVPPAFTSEKSGAFFFTRMLFSCLVDADYLDTEAFMSGGSVERGGHDTILALLEKLDAFIAPWWEPKTELNRKRCEILKSCIGASSSERGLFTLTVPTGGGKTIASVAFALNHAKKWGMKRLIYVIPYTSIIEQTQDVFNAVFGEKNVVAHYADVEYKTDEDGHYTDRRRLAAENWDAPIILTTSVQFFESLYANHPSRCRKLHNIAGSVVIFDEAQMFPVPYLKPSVSAIAQLIGNYGCSAVLCTATQPSLNRLFGDYLKNECIEEICPPSLSGDDLFRRVSFAREGVVESAQLAGKLDEEKQVLCVVNSRRQAQNIFSLLGGEGCYHLSTTMYPAHRRRMLAEVRERLKNDLPCRVVSTSLVETGVDVDFPAVYREIAGLDSMLQAGGRCNREGKRPAGSSVVHLFKSECRVPDIIAQNAAAAEHAMRAHEDILSPAAVGAYFDFLYYTLKDPTALDAKGILSEIDDAFMPFVSVASRFKLIEGIDHLVYIPREEGAKLTEALRYMGMSRGLMRELGRYAVGVYTDQFKALVESGAAEQVTENAAILRDLTRYSDATGLAFDTAQGLGLII